MIDFEQDYVLENEAVRLRPLMAGDVVNLLPFSEKEPELWKYSLAGADGKNNLEQYVHAALLGRKGKKEYPFIVYEKKSGRYAGSTRFYDIQPANETLQLGYTWYGREFQGTGLNKHCKFLLLSFAFEELLMKRVEFRADARNEKSIKAMKSIGCTVEGILRSNSITREGGRRDSIVLSILREEWEGGLRKSLKDKLSQVTPKI
jgi:N-acetyltransferase